METIICSAIWYDDEINRSHLPINIKSGIVVGGLRHCNCFTILSAIYQKKDYKIEKSIQGFLTSKNRFVDRIEGGKIAFQSKQIVDNIESLHSEDLW